MASDKVNYVEVGAIAQAIKFQIRTGGFWDELSGAAKESIDQIATAMARTVCGDGVHWDGIIGFAQAAKPGTADVAKDPMRSQVEGMRAIERVVREIPARNDHG